MEEKSKLEQMERFLSILNELQNTRKKMVERFAALQMETEQAGFAELSAKLGEASAATAKNFEKLDSVLHDFEIKRNQLKNEAS